MQYDHLGSGSYGQVRREYNPWLGRVIAVKSVKKPSAPWSNEDNLIIREGKIHWLLNHPNIVQCFGFGTTSTTAPGAVDILLELMHGDVHDLVVSRRVPPTVSGRLAFADALLRQMLSALDHLASSRLAYRDIKPDNILYVRLPRNTFLFKLADFGLARSFDADAADDTDAGRCVGSPCYRAPECWRSLSPAQGPEADVWALLVAVLWVARPWAFFDAFEGRGGDRHDVVRVVEGLVRKPAFRRLRPMAARDPVRRATAGEMLERLYGGEGAVGGRGTGYVPFEVAVADREPRAPPEDVGEGDVLW